MAMTSDSNSTTQADPGEQSALDRASHETVPAFNRTTHWRESLGDGTQVLIRPICKDDGDMERAFIESLSPMSRENRFLGQLKASDDVIRQLTDIDYERDMAFIALHGGAGEQTEIGVGRFCLAKDGESCECAVAVSDAWQRKGLGTLLMGHLIDVARQRGIKRMVSIDMAENLAMRHLAESLGFDRKIEDDYPSQVIHTLDL
jgi:GNAT superfamily N-acetyltransferase